MNTTVCRNPIGIISAIVALCGLALGSAALGCSTQVQSGADTVAASAGQSEPPAPGADRSSSEKSDTIRIRFVIEGKALTATMIDSETTRDFLSLLPLTLTLKDHASTEKVSDLPRRLSITGSPAGSDPSIGDIGYYAPWGNLALYYRDFAYSRGLVRLGTIDAGIEALSGPGPLQVTIERVE